MFENYHKICGLLKGNKNKIPSQFFRVYSVETAYGMNLITALFNIFHQQLEHVILSGLEILEILDNFLISFNFSMISTSILY